MDRSTSCFLQSSAVTAFFGSSGMRSVFDDRAVLQSWLDVEAALARAQGSLGLIPAAAAAVIDGCAKVTEIDLEAVGRDAVETAHPLVPLIRALVRRAGEPAGRYVHLGATTQDVMDTGYVLCARSGLDLVERHLDELAGILRRQAADHRTTVMAGRTHGQQALPTTFGLRVAGWADEVSRHRERLAQMRPRLLVGSFGGAVGTLAGYGPRGLELRGRVMRELGLGEPRTSWHANQDRFAECVAVLGMIAGTAEKLAREVYFLSRTEIGEVSEAQGDKQVGSSTMPHKRNPILSEAIIGASMTLRAQVPLAMAAAVSQDDRDMGPGMSLWKLVPESFILIGGILERSVEVLGSLRVDPARMRRNLDLTDGLILSEAVMLRLAEHLGRQAAHHVVAEASRRSMDAGISFIDCLLTHGGVAGQLTEAELRALLLPDTYIGSAETIVDQMLQSLA